MRASFLGFEIAKSGLQTAQTGLDVTGQNMSKMNTEGYSRQVVEQSTVYYDSTSYKYALMNSDKFGQGVSITQINQIRDEFLDTRYRAANSEDSSLSKSLSILTNIEEVFDETLNDGLSVILEEFYTRLQTLSSNTGDIEFSGLVRSSAQKITETLNYYNKQLETINEQEKFDLSVSIQDINTLTEKIVQMNKAVQFETLQGNPTNELLDTRNLYLDKLSSHINISTESNTDGTISVKVGSQYLIDSKHASVATVSLQDDTDGLAIITESGELEVISGDLKGYLDTLNGNGAYAEDSGNDFNGIPYYQKSLDDFAKSFAEMFNELNSTEKPLFAGDSASTIILSEEWLKNSNYITTTTSSDPSEGMNDNILRMIIALDSPRQISDKFNGAFDEYVSKLMTDIAIDVNFAFDMSKTASTVLSSVDNQREAIKGVSLNEETVNLMKYQKAFEASARVMTALDEMLDTIINRMGTVGR
ncbi:MAG: flagellar hook-associated protein FlgK [Clostridiales bacterium GWF2_38_85]|nr:MAG: flagellar hook-associated protein FlgK [Clostridiales bacterium GWF2_38_85]HBL83432.1 flagellar hook-associated protein FlgK [Clostridiales bacterium]